MMTTFQTHFFATRKDQLGLINSVEEREHFKYAPAGSFELPKAQIYSPGAAIPTLGVAKNESAIGGDCYLVVALADNFACREIRQAGSGIKYAFDQSGNPNSIIFLHGGFYQDILLYGKIGTVSNTVASMPIYKLFLSAVRTRFAKIGSYFVGPEAQEFARSGGRLTIAAQSPREYDLTLTQVAR
jgi:hypothetical protein